MIYLETMHGLPWQQYNMYLCPLLLVLDIISVTFSCCCEHFINIDIPAGTQFCYYFVTTSFGWNDMDTTLSQHQEPAGLFVLK